MGQLSSESELNEMGGTRRGTKTIAFRLDQFSLNDVFLVYVLGALGKCMYFSECGIQMYVDSRI